MNEIIYALKIEIIAKAHKRALRRKAARAKREAREAEKRVA
jgi:hypothetical protein